MGIVPERKGISRAILMVALLVIVMVAALGVYGATLNNLPASNSTTNNTPTGGGTSGTWTVTVTFSLSGSSTFPHDSPLSVSLQGTAQFVVQTLETTVVTAQFTEGQATLDILSYPNSAFTAFSGYTCSPASATLSTSVSSTGFSNSHATQVAYTTSGSVLTSLYLDAFEMSELFPGGNGPSVTCSGGPQTITEDLLTAIYGNTAPGSFFSRDPVSLNLPFSAGSSVTLNTPFCSTSGSPSCFNSQEWDSVSGTVKVTIVSGS